jgi:hypothetical protein
MFQMHQRIRGSRVFATLLLGSLASVALAACGSSSTADPSGLLKDTFAGSHKINSGNIAFTLTINPSGSSTLTGPIKLSFGGPFQSGATGKLPQSDFNVSVSALGKSGSLGILSTGSNGYVRLLGTSYQLPAATFKKLQSSFSQIGSTGGSSSNSSTLSKLGIRPLDWLQNSSVIGTENVGGAETTHIRAGVNVPALLTDVDAFLKNTASLGVPKTAGVANGLSAAARAQIAREVKNASLDVWTGNDDKTLRKLTIGVDLPVSGKTSTALGGMSSAVIGLSIQYAELNQAQTITAPKTVRPYSEFSRKIQALVQTLQGGAGSASISNASGGSGSSSANGTGSGSASGSGSALSGASTSVKSYSKCITAAGNDIAKMQRCASLLNGK